MATLRDINHALEASYDPKTLRIISLGKFEGEPRWVPHFYELWLDDGPSGQYYSIYVNAADLLQYPELVGFYQVNLHEDDQGFVRGEAIPEPKPHGV